MNSKKTEFIVLNTRKCAACFECVDACPKHVMGKVSFLWHKHAVVRNAAACIGCKKCIAACRYGALTER